MVLKALGRSRTRSVSRKVPEKNGRNADDGSSNNNDQHHMQNFSTVDVLAEDLAEDAPQTPETEVSIAEDEFELEVAHKGLDDVRRELPLAKAELVSDTVVVMQEKKGRGNNARPPLPPPSGGNNNDNHDKMSVVHLQSFSQEPPSPDRQSTESTNKSARGFGRVRSFTFKGKKSGSPHVVSSGSSVASGPTPRRRASVSGSSVSGQSVTSQRSMTSASSNKNGDKKRGFRPFAFLRNKGSRVETNNVIPEEVPKETALISKHSQQPLQTEEKEKPQPRQGVFKLLHRFGEVNSDFGEEQEVVIPTEDDHLDDSSRELQPGETQEATPRRGNSKSTTNRSLSPLSSRSAERSLSPLGDRSVGSAGNHSVSSRRSLKSTRSHRSSRSTRSSKIDPTVDLKYSSDLFDEDEQGHEIDLMTFQRVSVDDTTARDNASHESAESSPWRREAKKVNEQRTPASATGKSQEAAAAVLAAEQEAARVQAAAKRTAEREHREAVRRERREKAKRDAQAKREADEEAARREAEAKKLADEKEKAAKKAAQDKMEMELKETAKREAEAKKVAAEKANAAKREAEAAAKKQAAEKEAARKEAVAKKEAAEKEETAKKEAEANKQAAAKAKAGNEEAETKSVALKTEAFEAAEADPHNDEVEVIAPPTPQRVSMPVKKSGSQSASVCSVKSLRSVFSGRSLSASTSSSVASQKMSIQATQKQRHAPSDQKVEDSVPTVEDSRDQRVGVSDRKEDDGGISFVSTAPTNSSPGKLPPRAPSPKRKVDVIKSSPVNTPLEQKHAESNTDKECAESDHSGQIPLSGESLKREVDQPGLSKGPQPIVTRKSDSLESSVPGEMDRKQLQRELLLKVLEFRERSLQKVNLEARLLDGTLYDDEEEMSECITKRNGRAPSVEKGARTVNSATDMTVGGQSHDSALS